MQLATLLSSLVTRRSSLAKRLVIRNISYLLSFICYLLSEKTPLSKLNGVSNKTNRLTFKIKDYALTHVTFVWIILAIAAQRENLRCHRA